MNMIKFPHSTREIAHFIAKVLAARQTTSEEIPYVISTVRETLQALRNGPAPAVLPEAPQETAAEPRQARRIRDRTPSRKTSPMLVATGG